MEFEEKLELCSVLMYEDFGITTEQARKIICDLSIEDDVFEYYHKEIEDEEQEKRERWQEEIRLNSDIYGG